MSSVIKGRMTELSTQPVEIPGARFPVAQVTLSPNGDRTAEEILSEAKKRAADLLGEARAIAEKERSAAVSRGYDEGFKKGFLEGLRRGFDKLCDSVEQAKALVEEVGRVRKQALEGLEPEVVSLACEIAEKIVKKSVEVDPETVVRITKEALQNAGAQPPITLRVNPQDLEAVSQRLDQLRELCGHDVDLEKDSGVSRGGCIVESPAGSVDGTLETQLENIKEQLLELLTSVREETRKAS